MVWWQIIVDYFMSNVLAKNVSCGSKKTTMAQTNDRYVGHIIRPGNFQTCKRFVLYQQLLSSVIFNKLSTMNYIASVVELWWNDTDRQELKHTEENVSKCHSVYHTSRVDWFKTEKRPQW
jgi:DNA-binding protein